MNRIEEQDCKEIIDSLDPYLQRIKGKSFLIAGATSFLGTSIVNMLAYYNREIADSPSDKCEIFASYHDLNKASKRFDEYKKDPCFHLFEWDATKPLDEIPIIKSVDYIFYLCSIASTGVFIGQPIETIKANTVGLFNMLEFAQRCNCQGFLYFSSGAIYGAPQGAKINIDENDMWAMNHLDLVNIYAEGKRTGETICKAYYSEYGVPVKIVRISHTYGPGIDINDGRVFSDFVRNIIKQEDLIIQGDGSPTRPFCYIADAVRAFIMIVMDGRSGEAYNMANPKETYSIGELAEKLAFEAFPERGLEPKYTTTKGNIHPEKVYVNVDKLSALGWSCYVSVVEGFRRVVESIESAGSI